MVLKFALWAAGVIIVVMLGLTGYGVVSGELPWKDCLPFWTGIIGAIVGYVLRQPEK